jgi:hypothetical protein
MPAQLGAGAIERRLPALARADAPCVIEQMATIWG